MCLDRARRVGLEENGYGAEEEMNMGACEQNGVGRLEGGSCVKEGRGWDGKRN